MTATERASYTEEACATPACAFRLYVRRLDLRPMHPKRCPSCKGTEWTVMPAPQGQRAA